MVGGDGVVSDQLKSENSCKIFVYCLFWIIQLIATAVWPIWLCFPMIILYANMFYYTYLKKSVLGIAALFIISKIYKGQIKEDCAQNKATGYCAP